MIVDASVLLSAFFPDGHEPRAQAVIRDHAVGRVQLLRKQPSRKLAASCRLPCFTANDPIRGD